MANSKRKIKIIFSLLIGLLIGIFLLLSSPTAYLSDITPQKIIELTNKERQKRNIKPLTANQLLTKAAYQKAKDIFKSQSFQHNINNKKFSLWIKEVGYQYIYVGENLAIDFYTSEGVINAWLKSPTHRENLLNPNFQEIGVAVIDGKFEGHDAILVVQIFGTPQKTNIVLLREYTPQKQSYSSERFLTSILSFEQKLTSNNFQRNNTIKTASHKKTYSPNANTLTSCTYYQLTKFIVLLFIPYLTIIFIFSFFNTFYLLLTLKN